MQTAAGLKIQNLYSYQPLNLEWLKRIIYDDTIYLSNPRSFNDPWDCYPHFDSNLDTQEKIDAVIAYLMELYEKGLLKKGSTKILKSLKNNPKELENYINGFSADMALSIDEMYRIYCLTSKNSCPLMWGHYAQKHTGICLEFGVCNTVFCGALKVEYKKEYPLFQMHAVSVDENIKPLITKSTDWEYEDEYRLIALNIAESEHPDNNLLTLNGNFLKIQNNSLKSIIVGCQMSKSNKRKVYDLIKLSKKSINMKEAIRFPNKYSLKII